MPFSRTLFEVIFSGFDILEIFRNNGLKNILFKKKEKKKGNVTSFLGRVGYGIPVRGVELEQAGQDLIKQLLLKKNISV